MITHEYGVPATGQVAVWSAEGGSGKPNGLLPAAANQAADPVERVAAFLFAGGIFDLPHESSAGPARSSPPRRRAPACVIIVATISSARVKPRSSR